MIANDPYAELERRFFSTALEVAIIVEIPDEVGRDRHDRVRQHRL